MRHFLLAFLSVIFLAAPSVAQSSREAVDVLGLFRKELSPRGFFSGEVVHVESEPEAAPEVEIVEEPEFEPAKPSGPEFVSSDPGSHIVPPDQDPRVRINPEAPGPFKAMASAFQDGDLDTARAYADQFVRYQINLIYEVKELTSLIGEALIRQGVIDEESWDGVEQLLEREFATVRAENSSPIKSTHEEAMKRIKADPQGEVEIYFFFALNCSYCRQMAPDVERLWRLLKDDKRVRMVALTTGPELENWVDSFRNYAGWTVPVFEGEKLASMFNVSFVPSLVVVAPNLNKAYVKTGLQPLEHMFEFVRKVQGQSAEAGPELRLVQNTQIGEAEMVQRGGIVSEQYRDGGVNGEVMPVNTTVRKPKAKLARF